MAEPGDPPTDDHDNLIGFASPASLQGRTREPELAPEPAPEIAFAPEAKPEPVLEPEPQPEPQAAHRREPVEAGSIFEPSPEFQHQFRRRERPADIPGGGMGLYAVYALILFAVPTMGVSAVVGLLAVTGRDGPEDPLSQSHFIYQQRTLWAAAVGVGAGLILLMAPFALGVPLLFALALWVVARGAAGVWALKAGHPISDPRGWWIGNPRGAR